VLSNHGDPVRLKAIDYPGRVSLPIHSAVTYDLDLLVPLKGLEEVFVEIVLAPGDQDGPSASRFPWLRVRHVRYRNQSAANLEPDRCPTKLTTSVLRRTSHHFEMSRACRELSGPKSQVRSDAAGSSRDPPRPALPVARRRLWRFSARPALSANVSETVTSWGFNVEGEP
jgi:hypothetical protein